MFSYGHGRFTSPDDFLVASFPNEPQSWNLYRYALNNPLKYVDPSGQLEKENGKIKTRERKETDEEDKKLDVVINGKTYRVFGSATNDKTGKKYIIIGEVKKVWVFGEKDGKKIKATVGVGELKATEAKQYSSQEEADKAVIFDNDSAEVGGKLSGLSHSCNCHGTTFADEQVWINSSQIPTLLESDGYEVTDSPSEGDIGVWGEYKDKKSGVSVKNVEHSVTVSGVGENGNVNEVTGKDGVTSPRKSNPS